MNDNDRTVNQGEKGVYAEQGDVYITYSNDRKIPRHLTKPPFLPEVFLGRKDVLQAIYEKLFNGGNLLLLVNGNGGVGKTSVASYYYHTYQQEYSHTAWVLSEKNIANALLSYLATPLSLKFENTLPPAERLELLLVAMAELKKPCLLVIDNANEVDDLAQNHQNLRRYSNLHLLLTSRITEFEQVERYRIEGLPEADAIELFKKYYPKLQDDEIPILKQIRAAVDDNTLVIELMAKNLYLFNRLKTNYTLSELLTDLQTKGLLALSKSQAVGTDYQSKGTLRKEKPETIIAAMYDLGELPADEAALLSVFAVLPAESLSYENLEALLKSKNLDEHLLSLAQKGWLEYNENASTFKCSPVVQEIVRRRNPNVWQNCQPLIAVLTEKLDYEGAHVTGSKYDEAVQFAGYAESIIACFYEPQESIAILCDRVGSFHQITGNLSQALKYFNKQTDLWKQLYQAYPTNVGFKNGLAISYIKLGAIHEDLGNHDQTLKYYQQAKVLWEELVNSCPLHVEFKNNLSWINAQLAK